MQDLYATSFEIGSDDRDTAFQTIAEEIARWAWRGAGSAPNLLDEKQGTEEGAEYRLSWSSLALPDRAERALQAELRHPDPAESGIEWRTVVEVCRGAQYLRFSLRIAREATEFRLAPASLSLRRPRLVASILERFPCTSGGERLSTSPHVLHVGEVERFVAGVLHSSDRTLPVVIVSTPSGAEAPEVDVDELADELAGLAHVVTLGGYLAWERLRDVTGALEFVPPGGARIYWPGFGAERDRLRHPYWTRRRLTERGLPFRFQAFRKLSRLSVGRVPRDPLFRTLQHADRQRRLAEAREAQDDPELLGTYEEMLQEREQDIERLGGDLETLTEDNRKLKEDLDRQAEQWALVWRAAEDDEPQENGVASIETWEEFAEMVPALVTDAFALTDRALAQCDTNPYPDPDRMWDHLENLARAAEAYHRLNGSVGDRLKEWTAENFHIEIAMFDSDIDPDFEFEGSTHSREPHVKVDDYKKPDECGRIYFAVDSQANRFIVDHIGLHL